MSKTSYKPYYNAKTGEAEIEVNVWDLAVGVCAGLTAKKIVEGMSEAFCDKRGVITTIGTAALGLLAAGKLGFKCGAMFRSLRKSAKTAYKTTREIIESETKKEEDKPEETNKEEVKWDPAPDISEAELRIQYEHPEEWLCFSSYIEASKVFAFCIKSIAGFGYVSVADVKKEMNKDQILNYIDNVYGWSNLEDDFGIKREPDGRYSITRVKPYPIDILKQSEGIKHGESET